MQGKVGDWVIMILHWGLLVVYHAGNFADGWSCSGASRTDHPDSGGKMPIQWALGIGILSGPGTRGALRYSILTS